MSLNAAFDQALLAETPPLTSEGMLRAAERLLLVADEVCAIAERLNELAGASDEHDDPDEALVVSEQIARAIAWLNEAQGALLFG
jgi:hypothetical protein